MHAGLTQVMEVGILHCRYACHASYNTFVSHIVHTIVMIYSNNWWLPRKKPDPGLRDGVVVGMMTLFTVRVPRFVGRVVGCPEGCPEGYDEGCALG